MTDTSITENRDASTVEDTEKFLLVPTVTSPPISRVIVWEVALRTAGPTAIGGA
ncbi:hypothetical protein [Embleya sp. NPDC020630]|uniref:hypothetical protein n=1 Tax=Embleya sp. NPDC020630 TaxID=3363979 RepID=UPI003787521A